MDPLEKAQEPTASDNNDDEILEKTTSQRQVQSAASEGDSSSEHSENDVLQLLPQLTRRGTVNPDSPQFSTEKFLRDVLVRAKEQGLRRRNAGVLFRSLVVLGYGSEFTHQNTVGTVASGVFRIKDTIQSHRHPPMKTILYSMDGCVKEGEMLLVLGKPGSGATTLLKTIAGETRGYASISGDVHYNGIPAKIMHERFRGEVAYNGEVDVHFPHLTVGQTLTFATKLRTPHRRLDDMPRKKATTDIVKILGTVFGLRHTFNTKVGNDYVRGVSGGERKRVSIAETMSARSVLACWDNSTRGLDASSALEFVQALRVTTNLIQDAAVVAIYQAGERVYEVFDKVTVLYEGRQIYFGRVETAKQYFIDQGWECMERQTTADFLTAVTDPTARLPRPGFESQVPVAPDDFARLWQQSPERTALLQEMEAHELKYPKGKEAVDDFMEASKMRKSKNMPKKSPYTVTIWMQISACIIRAYQRMWGDKSTLVSTLMSNLIMSLVIGSVFYNIPENTSGFFSKAGVMFFGILFNAFQALGEISQMYEQRPIIQKHKSQALYRPAADALATFIADIPVKLLSTTIFDIILYFMTGLSRTPGQFFTFYLFTFAVLLSMLSIFRTIAALTRTVEQALSIAGIMVLAIANYAGYSIPKSSMKPWFSWIFYINPVSYGFEALMANEFAGQNVLCAALIPPYPGANIDNQVCVVTGAIPGQDTVSGARWLELSYGYSADHIWRNLGIIIAFFIFFTCCFLVAVEFSNPPDTRGEVLVFPLGKEPEHLREETNAGTADEETGQPSRERMDSGTIATRTITNGNVDDMKQGLVAPKDIFTWKDVCCDVHIKGETRRILSNVSGYVKPGTLTALMGESGAGKTTLLDTLAQRNETGIITGDMFVNGKPLPAQFQRSCGYVQQQDVHMAESTVREALRFSALLRQPRTVSVKEKYEYVETVIDLLEMREYADAVIGVPGEGLNVLQRKKLTIGVEMAAKPALLLFCDEPTSGLDSQAAWGVVQFLRKLADAGQSILCTIHQPSAVLFEQFDRLLLLQKGGKTVYFGDTGNGSKTLIDYFERNGGSSCPPDANPAEYILEQIGAGATATAEKNWHEVWLSSPEKDAAANEIEAIHTRLAHVQSAADNSEDTGAFAMPFGTQFKAVTVRTFQHYYRSPTYIGGKFVLSCLSALFIGFTFYMEDNTVQGFQNKLFAVFMTTTIGTALINQIQPRFFFLRDLYEIRERPSKIYHWLSFLFAAVLAEIPWNLLVGTLFFFGWYFPVGFWNHVSIPADRAAFQWLFLMVWMLFISTFAQFISAFTPNAPTAAMITSLMFSLVLIFAGVFQPLASLIGFWHWMYWVSPIQFMVSATVSNALHGIQVRCTPQELNIIQPPSGLSCQQYLGPFLQSPINTGQLLNPSATSDCQYCRFAEGDAFLATLNMYWDQRWRNFGIFCGYLPRFVRSYGSYIVFNFFMIFVLFYYTRIAKLEKKSAARNKITAAKEMALRVGGALESTMVRKTEGTDGRAGIDHSMNTANFAIFQGAGLETLDSRGLGREWTRRDEHTD